MTDYIITQTDRVLTASAIKLVKYENKVSRLVFELDGTIPRNLRLYCAFLNPVTRKYFYSPVLYENETPYIIIGTEITYYPSKRWEMLLIGISPDTYIDETFEIDDSLVVWSSFSFKKLLVLDTFLDDDAIQITHPNIEKQLTDLTVLHDNVVAFAAQTGEDVTSCEVILNQCQELFAEITHLYDEANTYRSAMQTQYNSFMATMRSTFNQYMDELRAEKEDGGV